MGRATTPTSEPAMSNDHPLLDPNPEQLPEPDVPPRVLEPLSPKLVEFQRMVKARREAERRARNTPWGRLKRTIYSVRAGIVKRCYSVVRFVWKWTLHDWFHQRFWIKMAKSPESAVCEVEALRFVRRNTTLPVPRVYGSYTWNRLDYILMQKMPGTMLELTWDSYSEEQKTSVCRQLKNWMDELRKLESPYGTQVCSAVGGPMRDNRLIFLDNAGPFVDELHMNAQMAYPGGRALDDDEPPVLKVPFHRAMEGAHRIVFTHGDLCPRNILVQDDVVTAIIDWESSGWFPEHWEYVKAHHGLGWRVWLRKSWGPYIETFLKPYKEEKAADDHMVMSTFPGVSRNLSIEQWTKTRHMYLAPSV